MTVPTIVAVPPLQYCIASNQIVFNDYVWNTITRGIEMMSRSRLREVPKGIQIWYVTYYQRIMVDCRKHWNLYFLLSHVYMIVYVLTHRHSDTHTHRHKQTHTHIHRYRHRHKQTHRHTDRLTDTQTIPLAKFGEGHLETKNHL